MGFTPAYHHGVPWQFTFEDLDSIDLSGQTAIVTGANAGIGYAVSEHLFKLGADVTMACRNPKKCDAAAAKIGKNNGSSNGNVKTGLIDTESMASVKAFATQYSNDNKGTSLDMLYLNAGTAFTNPDYDCVPSSVDGVEKIFATNYVGHHLLFRLLEPALQKSKLARVVSTASNGAYTSYSYQVATDLETLNGCTEPFTKGAANLSYGQSKLAQIVWTKYLARRYLGPESNIYANAFHPGAVATEIWEKTLSQARAPQFTVDFFEWLKRETMWTPAEGALTGLFLGAATDRIVRDNLRGRYYHPQAQEVVNPVALNQTLQDQLWEFSEELVKDFL